MDEPIWGTPEKHLNTYVFGLNHGFVSLLLLLDRYLQNAFYMLVSMLFPILFIFAFLYTQKTRSSTS